MPLEDEICSESPLPLGLDAIEKEALDFPVDMAKLAGDLVGELNCIDYYQAILQNLNEILRVLDALDPKDGSFFLGLCPFFIARRGGADAAVKLFDWISLQLSSPFEQWGEYSWEIKSDRKSVTLKDGAKKEDVLRRLGLFVDYINYLYSKHISDRRRSRPMDRKFYSHKRDASLFAEDLQKMRCEGEPGIVPFGEMNLDVDRIIEGFSNVDKGETGDDLGYAVTDLMVAEKGYMEEAFGDPNRCAYAYRVQKAITDVHKNVWRLYLGVLGGELKGANETKVD